jgi:hypothetical protein
MAHNGKEEKVDKAEQALVELVEMLGDWTEIAALGIDETRAREIAQLADDAKARRA